MKTLAPILLAVVLLVSCKSPSLGEMAAAVNDCARQSDPAACLGARAASWAGADEQEMRRILRWMLDFYRSTQSGESLALASGPSGAPVGCARLSDFQVSGLRRYVAGQGWDVYASFGPDESLVALRGLFGCYGLREGQDQVMVPGGISLRGLLEHRRPFDASRPDPAGESHEADCSPTSEWAKEGWAEPRRCVALRESVEAVELNRERVFGDPASRGAVDLVAEEIFAALELDPCAPELADFPVIVAAYLVACADDFVRCGSQDEAWAPIVARAAGVP